MTLWTVLKSTIKIREREQPMREYLRGNLLSRQTLKDRGTHKGREADDGKGSDGVDTTRAGLKA